MKKVFMFSCLLIIGLSHSQYSNYYNLNLNVNKNISGSIYEYKTIKTIDYGALRLANAQEERNMLERKKFEDEQQKKIASEIYENPLKAFDYGLQFSTRLTGNREIDATFSTILESRGFKKANITFTTPNELLFSLINSNNQAFLTFQNISFDDVKTDLHMDIPLATSVGQKIPYEENFDKIVIGKEIEDSDYTANGELRTVLYHKKELNRATVYNERGYRMTVAWEDKFEYGISDQYFYNDTDKGYFVLIEVRYYGNKSEVNFEKLEGRRYYLKPLIEKIISTAYIGNIVRLK